MQLLNLYKLDIKSLTIQQMKDLRLDLMTSLKEVNDELCEHNEHPIQNLLYVKPYKEVPEYLDMD